MAGIHQLVMALVYRDSDGLIEVLAQSEREPTFGLAMTGLLARLSISAKQMVVVDRRKARELKTLRDEKDPGAGRRSEEGGVRAVGDKDRVLFDRTGHSKSVVGGSQQGIDEGRQGSSSELSELSELEGKEG